MINVNMYVDMWHDWEELRQNGEKNWGRGTEGGSGKILKWRYPKILCYGDKILTREGDKCCC